MVNLLGAAGLAATALWIWPQSRAARLSAASFRYLRLGAGLGLAGAMVAVAPTGSWAVLLAAAGAAATAAGLARRMRHRRVDRRERVALVAALRSLIRELDSGADPLTAARRTAAEQPEWLADLLVAAICHDDAGEHPRWRNVAERLVAAASACARHGISLTVMVRPIADDLADRAAAIGERDSHTAGPALSGYVLAALPIGGILLGAGMGADPIGVLFGSGLGSVLLLAGVGLVCAGLGWADRIVAGGSRA